jgi:hypothetical protein
MESAAGGPDEGEDGGEDGGGFVVQVPYWVTTRAVEADR